ncbi:MAG: glycosyltransferase family 39 protein, partial [Planctomycetes bacterium]|nr:glycosyltransferase family 39 protein [Planctomycetota bacterium]
MTGASARDYLPALTLPLALAVGLWWSWGTWPDVLIDFGRELYTPWRLAEGDVLYRDVAYFNGPVSPYLNSLWFRLFGSSLLTLVIANTVVLAAAVGLVYRLVMEIAGPAAALLAGLTFIAVFAFGQYVGAGNYNWICPYSHEITHGITLSLVAICLAWRNSLDRRWWSA